MCTVKDVATTIDDWCTWHLTVGFEHLYVYFDDPAEFTAVDLQARFNRRVTAIPVDDQLRQSWNRSWPGNMPRADALPRARLNARQELNARHALQLAVSRGLEWLIHLVRVQLRLSPGTLRV